MKSLTIQATAVLIFATATRAVAMGPSGAFADYGAPSSAAVVDRQIALDSGTRAVNVNNGETIKFTLHGKSFTWRFDTLPNKSVIDLSSIAPNDLAVKGIRVYIGTNPLYAG